MSTAREIEIQRLVVRLVGDMSAYKRMMGDAAKFTSQKMKAIGAKATQVGGNLTRRLTLPIVAIGGASVKAFADFDKAMNESTAIMSVTEEQIGRMREEALKLSQSGEITKGPKELAEAYFFLASAGKNAEQSIGLLSTVSKFATAGNFDMALATDLLTDAQSALGMSSKDIIKDQEQMARLADVLVKANTLANATVQQFSESLTNTAAASLKTFNKDVEEGVAVLAAYADQGVKGQVAGTNLSRIMLLLSKSSRDAADEHEKFGFRVFDSTGQMRNFADILQNLEQVTAGMSDETKSATLEQLGFQARVQQAILPLIGASEAVRNYEAQLRDAGGTVQEVSEKQMKGFSNQMIVLKNQLTAVAIEIGTALIPLVKSLSEKISEGIKWWKSLDEQTKNFIVNIGVILAVLGPVILIFGQLTTALGAMAGMLAIITTNAALMKGGMIALAVGGIVLLAREVYRANDAIKEFNEQLEKSDRLANKVNKQELRRQENFFKGVADKEGPDRLEALQSQLKAVQKNLESRKLQIQTLQERAKVLGESPLGDVFDPAQRIIKSKEIEGVEQQAKEQKARQEVEREFKQRLEDQIKAEKEQLKDPNAGKNAKNLNDIRRGIDELVRANKGEDTQEVRFQQGAVQ